MSAPYKWLGRKIRHAHGAVGKWPKLSDENVRGLILGDGLEIVDYMMCKCGYLVCSKTGQCAPKPVDVLPDGWRDITHPDGMSELYKHDKGALVSRLKQGIAQPSDQWSWTLSEDVWGYKPTRDEAMAAALTSGKTDDALPEGWTLRPGFLMTYDHATADSVSGTGEGWVLVNRRGVSDYAKMYATRTDAMDAALEAAKPKDERKCIECGHVESLHPNPISAHAFEARPLGCDCMHGYSWGCAVHDKPKAVEPELRPGWRHHLSSPGDLENDALNASVFRQSSGYWAFGYDETVVSGFVTADEAVRSVETIAAERGAK